MRVGVLGSDNLNTLHRVWEKPPPRRLGSAVTLRRGRQLGASCERPRVCGRVQSAAEQATGLRRRLPPGGPVGRGAGRQAF